MSGHEMKWWRCMAITRAPLCAELSSAATACSSRAAIPLAVIPLAAIPLAAIPLAGTAPWRM